MFGSIATMMKSSIIAQFISVITALLVARVFEVPEVGEYSVFIMCATIISSVIYLRLELSLGHKDIDHVEVERQIISKVKVFTLPIVAVSLMSLQFIYDMYEEWLNIFILLIAIYVLGGYRLMYYALCHENDFKRVADVKVKLAVFLLTFTVLYSSVGTLSLSLMASFISSYSLLIFLYSKKNRLYVSLSETVSLLKRKHDYFIKMTFGSMLGILSSYSIMLVVSLIYSIEAVGYYAVAEKLFRTPLSILQTSVADVFRVRLNGLKNKSIAWKFLSLNIVLSVFFVAVVYYAAPFMVRLLLGDNWLYVIDIVIFLLPISLFQMILQPMLPVFQQGEKSAFELVFNSLYVAIVFSFGFVVATDQDYFFENISFYLVPLYLSGLLYFVYFICRK